MKSVLLDTDIILDFFFDKKPFSEYSAQILSLCESKEIIIQALNSKFKDFEDALQNYSAEVSENIDVVITRNTKDYKNSNLSIMTPETYIKTKTAST